MYRKFFMNNKLLKMFPVTRASFNFSCSGAVSMLGKMQLWSELHSLKITGEDAGSEKTYCVIKRRMLIEEMHRALKLVEKNSSISCKITTSVVSVCCYRKRACTTTDGYIGKGCYFHKESKLPHIQKVEE